MDKPKRHRREEPERTGPNRGPSNYYRDSDSWEDQASSSTQTESEGKSPLDSMAEEVTNTVKRAYEILDDSFLQGRKDGEKFRKGVHEKDSKEDTLQWLLSSMVRLNRDLAGFWTDAIETFVKNPEFLLGLMGAGRGNGVGSSSNESGEPGPSANGASGNVAIDFQSSGRIQVTLDIRPSPTLGVPYVDDLHAVPANGTPPLTDVSLRLDQGATIPVLKLKIPDKQPAGLYVGHLLDPKSHEERGTLRVRVLARD